MQLEDYFDFQRPDDIRLKGHGLALKTFCMNIFTVNVLQRKLSPIFIR
jgi:hypothetical protein